MKIGNIDFAFVALLEDFGTASGTFRNCVFFMGPFLVPVSSYQDHIFFVISGHVSGYVSVGASAHPDSTILEGLKKHTENPLQTYRFYKIVGLGSFGAQSRFSKTFQVQKRRAVKLGIIAFPLRALFRPASGTFRLCGFLRYTFGFYF